MTNIPFILNAINKVFIDFHSIDSQFSYMLKWNMPGNSRKIISGLAHLYQTTTLRRPDLKSSAIFFIVNVIINKCILPNISLDNGYKKIICRLNHKEKK